MKLNLFDDIVEQIDCVDVTSVCQGSIFSFLMVSRQSVASSSSCREAVMQCQSEKPKAKFGESRCLVFFWSNQTGCVFPCNILADVLL